MAKKDDVVRIELRYDAVKDAEILNFIDTYGNTRAGFIKNVLVFYKNEFEKTEKTATPQEAIKEPVKTPKRDPKPERVEVKKQEPEKPKKRQLPKLGAAFSSNDFNLED